MSVFDVISLFGGLAMFLYGMRLMGDGLKDGSTGTLKKAMELVTNNPVKAFLLGVLVTAVIQSSTATIVITSGLVGAGILTLRQSFGIIIGANVGTTVTGQIIRLLDVDASGSFLLRFLQPSTLAPLALIIGIICIMFLRFRNSRVIGTISIGFGILFSGLLTMTSSVSVLAESGAFDRYFMSLNGNPFIGYLTGFVISFILQSSSATVGILQAFSTSGLLSFKAVYPVILGIYLGDCLTTYIVCAIGSKPDAKRVGFVNVVYNLGKTVLVFIGVAIAHRTGLLDRMWDAVINSGGIANSNTVFNLACALLLMPFTNIYEKVSRHFIKDEPPKENPYADLLDELNPIFFRSPAIAFRGCYNVLLTMLTLSKENIKRAMELLHRFDEAEAEKVKETEEFIDLMTDSVSKYLLAISSNVKEDLHVRIMDQYYKVVTEFERLGDHATNIAETAERIKKKDIVLSGEAMEEIEIIGELITRILDYTEQTFRKRDVEAAKHIEPLEEVIDDLVNAMKDHHINRIKEGLCSMEGGAEFLNFLSDIERISDICSNVGVATVARVYPELAEQAHDYISLLHQGGNEEFNKEYKQAHDEYFAKLDGVTANGNEF